MCRLWRVDGGGVGWVTRKGLEDASQVIGKPKIAFYSTCQGTHAPTSYSQALACPVRTVNVRVQLDWGVSESMGLDCICILDPEATNGGPFSVRGTGLSRSVPAHQVQHVLYCTVCGLWTRSALQMQ